MQTSGQEPVVRQTHAEAETQRVRDEGAQDRDGDPAISVRALAKRYRVERRRGGAFSWLRSFLAPAFEDVQALDGVTFSIARGEIVGLLGPNGAGKSTTVKIMCGVLHPTEGEVRVLGRDPHRQRIENGQEIGVLFGHRSHLLYELPPIDSFRFLRAVYQIEEGAYRRTLARLTDVLELGPLLHQVVRTLSLGQRMRCEVAATFLHSPKVVYLDEPTIGLDVNAKRTIRAFIRSLVDELGTTVVLTTHDLADIEELCERVILIDHGRVVYDGSLRRLRERCHRVAGGAGTCGAILEPPEPT
jgi:ABC-2 type transport system ATP-binding protein